MQTPSKGYAHVDNDLQAQYIGEKSKIDFPFDLNNLFNMNYSFDQLKAAIEYLANQQNVQQTLINDLLNRDPMKETFKVIERTETIIKEPSTVINQPTTIINNTSAPNKAKPV